MKLLASAPSWAVLALMLGRLLPGSAAIELDLDDPESIRRAAATAAAGLTKYYIGHHPGQVPGNLPPPYYWWEAGAMFGALIDYWFYTEDDTYVNITTQAMLHQASETRNFMPPNQTRALGNDDQAFWGMAAMAAAERRFPDPPPDQPQWLALVQGVFNSQTLRWDDSTCGGGLRWQIFRFNNGFTYKNTISNGCFFNIAARLALYTENNTYAEWAERMYEWTENVGLVTDRFQFLDGSDELKNCSDFNLIQWSYNAGVYLHGAAAMYKYTNGSAVWQARLQGILEGLSTFFFEDTNIMFEVACEPPGTCEVDQRSFKAYLARWMAATTQLAPFTQDFIMPKLRASAQAAARACSGGLNSEECGLKWTTGSFDGALGVGEQMAALEIFQSNLIGDKPDPYTSRTGGTSLGDPNAGLDEPAEPDWLHIRPITTGDKAGAGILTAVVVGLIVSGSYWATFTG